MKLIDILAVISDCDTVIVMNTDGETLDEYNGRDSISEEYNGADVASMGVIHTDAGATAIAITVYGFRKGKMYADYDNGRYFTVEGRNGSGLNFCTEYAVNDVGELYTVDADACLTDSELRRLAVIEL